MQHLQGSKYREKVIAASRKKIDTRTKPTVLTQDGTFYRVINVIICEVGKEYYITTRKQLKKIRPGWKTSSHRSLGINGRCMSR